MEIKYILGRFRSRYENFELLLSLRNELDGFSFSKNFEKPM